MNRRTCSLSRVLVVLVGAPAAYAALIGAGFLLRRHGVRIPPYDEHNNVGGLYTLLSLAAFGYGLAFPAAYVAAGLALARRGRRGLGVGLALGSATVLALAVWARFVEPATLVERRYEVITDRAPPRPIRVLHLSDLQTDGPCRRERLAADAARRGDPDLIIITGDFSNGFDDAEHADARLVAVRNLLGGLRARHGIFAVLGDWDGWGEDWPRWERDMLAGSSVRVLRNESARVIIEGTPVVVYGVEGGGPSPSPVVADLSAEPGLRIIAAHEPDVAADQLRPGSADLVLAGHTHGGQVVLPFVGPLITRSARGFVGGRYALGGTPMLVSRGIGMRGAAAPRVRFRCPPEIGWVTVRR